MIQNMRTRKMNLLTRIQKSSKTKIVAFTLALTMFFQIGFPTVSWALTSGPGQPEYSSFEPASTSDMVDLYTGSFTYNIPLLSVPGPNGGYPINIAYHSGSTMDEEASWVGLGWSLNVGALNRQMQGIPDDYCNDQIDYKMNQKETWSVSAGMDITGPEYKELAGYPVSSVSASATPASSLSAQIYYNNYKGLGYRVSYAPNFLTNKIDDLNMNVGLSLSFDSQNGIGLNPSLSVGRNLALGVSANYNNRTGLNGINFSMSPNFLGRVIKGIAMTQIGKYHGTQSTNLDSYTKHDGKSNIFTGAMSSTVSFSYDGQIPGIQAPTKSNYIPLNLRFVGDAPLFPVFTADPGTSLWEGAVSFSNLENDGEFSGAGYGTLYQNDASISVANGTSVVQDFTKKNIQYSKKVPNLSPSKNTYDLFTFSGQGTGGFFRPYTEAVPVFSEMKKTNITETNGGTVEFGKTVETIPVSYTELHVGVGYQHDKGTQTVGDWDTYNGIPVGEFEIYSARQVKMKMAGEPTAIPLTEDNLDDWQGDVAVRNELQKLGGFFGAEFTTTPQLLYYEGSSAGTDANLSSNPGLDQVRTKDNRNTSVKYLTDDEAQKFGYSKSYDFYTPGTPPTATAKSFTTHNAQHISEIIVTQPEGSKYIYGLPVYNKKHEEFSYNINSSVSDGVYNEFEPNIDAVDAGPDDIDDVHNYNSLPSDHTKYYNHTEMPEYAYSWLLTGVVGNDYIDVNQTGIDDEDKGYWVKFEYMRKHTDYKWRVPYVGANVSEGTHKSEIDNVASFTYGEKEIYYIYTIKTKTHIAVFETEAREDARGAYGKFTSIGDPVGSQAQEYLKTIKLYTREEYEKATPVPLQVVHFEYDYSLCPSVLNNTGTTVGSPDINANEGKLTLKKIWFTYENSNKGSLSPYQFEYNSANPTYTAKYVDRWGDYKENENAGVDGMYPYLRFPYADQTAATLENWDLVQIKLPTGGTINVEYERNDYAYVEDQPAMQMFDIVGVGNGIGGTDDDILATKEGSPGTDAWYDDPNGTGAATVTGYPDHINTGTAPFDEAYARLEHENANNDGYRVFFKLDREYTNAEVAADNGNNVIRTKYLKGIDRIWFKNLTELRGGFQDYVAGYAEIKLTEIVNSAYFGMCKELGAGSGDNYTLGYITVDKVPLQENGLGIAKANPMTKAGLQYTHMDRPDIDYTVMPATTSALSQVLNFIPTAVGALPEVLSMLLSYNVYRFAMNRSKFIRLNGHSIIRLHDSDGYKRGGGSRVKKISINDNWITDTGNPGGGTAPANQNGIYGQKYVYNMSGIEGDPNTISSGVAYEPQVGGEESALRKPVDYINSHQIFSAFNLFVEKPVLDIFYPGPGVGYRKVTMYSIGKDQAADEGVTDINHNSTAPATVYEFFTPKDFPIYADETDVSPIDAHIAPVIIPGIYTYYEVKKARSQGYSIVLNDMAGKIHKVSSYRLNDNNTLGGLISCSENIYNTQAAYSDGALNRLSSTVQIMKDHDTYTTGLMGQTTDIYQERNEARLEDNGWGLEGNLDLFLPSVGVPLIAPTIYPSFSHTETSMKTIVTHKVIHRSGILMKTITTTDQSTVQNENLAFDMYTGEPVLTKTNNLYDDAVYALNYPAHWYYNKTGPVQTNDYLIMTAPGGSPYSMTAGVLTLPSTGTYTVDNFTTGDEIAIINTAGTTTIAHVSKVDYGTDQIWLVNKNGYILGSASIAQIHMRNSGFKNMQSAKVGSIAFKELGGYSAAVSTSDNTLTYGKILNAGAIELSDVWQSDCTECPPEGTETGGAYVNPFLSGIRNQWRPKKTYAFNTDRVYNGDSRTEGYFEDFTRFTWENPAIADAKWILANTTTKYSPEGFELEGKDALNNFSSAHYGYKKSLVTAIASNSRYNEMFNDNFEDYYDGEECYEDRMLTCTLGSFGPTIINQIISDDAKHTGKYSLVTNSTNATIGFTGTAGDLTACDDHDAITLRTTADDPEYAPDPDGCDCLGKMKVKGDATETYKYVFSAWVKVDQTYTTKPTSYTDCKVEIIFKAGGTTLVTYNVTPDADNKIIEGWQRLYYVVEVPATTDNFLVNFKNLNTAAGPVYYDDIRIHPFDGNMKTLVYDPVSLKLAAELDANNYATFYTYDEEGNLIHVKKETERGIKTLSEGRKELRKL